MNRERIDEGHAFDIGQSAFVYESVNSKKKKVKGKIDVSVSLTVHGASEERERFISFVNSTPTFDGGFHHDRVRRIFINIIKEKLERAAKKEKVTINDNDVLMGLTLSLVSPCQIQDLNLKQRKLVRDNNLEKAIEELMGNQMPKFLRKIKSTSVNH